MQKKISIIIPVYKVEDYIHQCIQSIIQQDVEHSAVECILINDCTPDRSMKVLEDTLAAYDGGMDFRILNQMIVMNHTTLFSMKRNMIAVSGFLIIL